MARVNLKTVEGLESAWEDTFTQLQDGTINELRANTNVRVLNGIQKLKIDLRLKVLNMIRRSKSPMAEKQAELINDKILEFHQVPLHIEEKSARI